MRLWFYRQLQFKQPFLSLRGMKKSCAAFAVLFVAAHAIAGNGNFSGNETLDPPRFEVSLQSGYLFGVFGNPDSYEIGPEFVTGRIRWGVVANVDSGWRGYNQFCFTILAEPIIRGVESRYIGVNFGDRYNFVRPHCRFVPYMFFGLGMGDIDSHPDLRGSQGQDFTFNILSAIGVSYQLDDHWKVDAGILYQHLSNGGQTDPNPSLNLLGPQVGLSYSF
jgi:lipid A 3-O-deacylase